MAMIGVNPLIVHFDRPVPIVEHAIHIEKNHFVHKHIPSQQVFSAARILWHKSSVCATSAGRKTHVFSDNIL